MCAQLPVKLLLPADILAACRCWFGWSSLDGPCAKTADKLMQREFYLLGLGDIVLPGLLAALALRFDVFLASVMKLSQVGTDSLGDSPGFDGIDAFSESQNHINTVTLPYGYRPRCFMVVVCGYAVGLAASMLAASFGHAQVE